MLAFDFRAVYILAALYVVSSIIKAWMAREKLSKIPTIGPPGIFSSYLGAYRFLTNGRDMIQEGYEKYPGSVFRVPMMSRWVIVASGPQMLEDIRKATDDQLSMKDAVAETVQIIHTLGPEVYHEDYHVATIRSPLTRNIATRFPDIQEEIVEAFAEHIPQTKEWSNVVALPAIMKIIFRTTNRLLVGLPLCRNSDYGSLITEFTVDVMKAAYFINLFPNLLKPIVALLFTNVRGKIKRIVEHLRPIIEERLKNEKLYGKDWPGKPNDLISWLLDTAPGHLRESRDLALRVVVINFAAIHTTSMAFTQVLFDLAAHPSYLPALREEVDAVIKEEGLTKASVQRMDRLDSFIKESQRLASTGALGVARKTLQDFQFSDGTIIPKGNFIAVPQFSTHHDEANYIEPNKFDGFRFVQASDKPDSNAHQMVSLRSDYLVFGNGRHACPGRFFAANELKAVLAHVLLTYDVAFENNGPRPQDCWHEAQSFPDPTVSVMFRRRQS